MAKVITTETVKGAKAIFAHDKVEFTWNGKDKHHKKDDVSTIHPEFAAKMKAKGLGDYDAGKVKNTRPTKVEDTKNDNV